VKKRFRDKAGARRTVWDWLQSEHIARFPFPPHGRIPNFAGAGRAAARLFEHPLLRKARRIKVNPDAPQRPVRLLALRRGITVFVPTPRLRGGFMKLDPRKIPKDHLGDAASLSKCRRWAEDVALDELPRMDLIVAGSVAVTRDGRRCGKGEGYSDLEFAVLRELGHPPAPVATTVHSAQIVEHFPRDANDLPLSLIVTPEEVVEVENPPPAPRGIDWSLLSERDLEEMPILRGLKRKRKHAAAKGRKRKSGPHAPLRRGATLTARIRARVAPPSPPCRGGPFRPARFGRRALSALP
jgi:5-formyltetrahydrofolate cyclo-ligase